ncbi:hypothetical protein PLICRDRAFT_174447 [Plicaturopsis crispa FD-325 SS-3]|nr:hypothetical protein PLICRDRAFT_174447 [Plicaturopsis crispa FD-325 SS-3]
MARDSLVQGSVSAPPADYRQWTAPIRSHARLPEYDQEIVDWYNSAEASHLRFQLVFHRGGGRGPPDGVGYLHQLSYQVQPLDAKEHGFPLHSHITHFGLHGSSGICWQPSELEYAPY